MPPMLASAPGSMGKNRPVDLISSLSCLRVTPGCTVTVRSSGLTESTRFMRETSRLMPPCTASKWPSSEEPTPNGITGTLCCAHSLTASATSCVHSANTTAAGGGTVVKADSSRPCCSRITCAVEQLSPKRTLRASRKAAGTSRWAIARWAAGVGAFMGVSCGPLEDVRPIVICLPVYRVTGKDGVLCQTGQGDMPDNAAQPNRIQQHTMGNRLSQIATRTGDNGTTAPGNNQRVAKNSLRVHAMGDVDELNSHIGLLLCEEMPCDVRELLVEVQHQLC